VQPRSFVPEPIPSIVEVPGNGDNGIPDLVAKACLRHLLQLSDEDARHTLGKEIHHVAFLGLHLDAASPNLLGELVWN
jgi:hypothetical protein